MMQAIDIKHTVELTKAYRINTASPNKAVRLTGRAVPFCRLSANRTFFVFIKASGSPDCH
jgi:hypothetical protein